MTTQHRQALILLVLYGSLPPLTLLSMNIESIPPVYALRPAMAITAIALAAHALLFPVVKDATRSALIIALTILLLIQPLVGESVRRVAYWDPSGALASTAAGLWILTLLVGLGLALLRKSLPGGLGSLMLVAGIGLMVVPILRILAYGWALSRPYPLPGAPQEPSTLRTSSVPLPDIYYIILDGYGRQGILLDLYGLDNTGFLTELENRGFFVAHQSQSNYSQTALSLASSLNMAYLDQVAAMQRPSSADRRPDARLIRHSALRALLEGHGYAFRSISTGYRVTEVEDAWQFQRAPVRAVNSFENLVAESMSLGKAIRYLVALGWLSEFPGYQDQRDRIVYAFSQLH